MGVGCYVEKDPSGFWKGAMESVCWEVLWQQATYMLCVNERLHDVRTLCASSQSVGREEPDEKGDIAICIVALHSPGVTLSPSSRTFCSVNCLLYIHVMR